MIRLADLADIHKNCPAVILGGAYASYTLTGQDVILTSTEPVTNEIGRFVRQYIKIRHRLIIRGR